MKLIHLSDLHIGKRVNDFSMLEEQEYILTKIINIVDDEKPDAVIIAGDVYDKSVPSAEAVSLFDDFLVRLSEREPAIFVISGNHDSAERIAFGGRLMTGRGVYMSPVYSREIKPVTLTDQFGGVDFYMLPFIKPVHVRSELPDREIVCYSDAVETAISEMKVDASKRSVLITHQLVTGAARCESEDISVGGTDNVDASVFDPFDYVALGHIHRPQSVTRDTIRYCGTPLKYSFSESGDEKSVTVVELREKGSVEISTVPLIPLHDMRELRGSYDELTLRTNYENTATDDYLRITLTDENDIPDVMGKLQIIYKNLMRVDYDNTRTRKNEIITGADDVSEKTPLELFSEFYEQQNNQPMTEEQKKYMSELIENVRE
ncbi:MAG: exonuclease SbcCD subunit D, partial [Candidatus Ornithomonoglobus sp.]